MPLRFAEAAPEAYHYPLTIGHLLDAAMVSAAGQEIVYRDRVRYTYRDLRARIGRLASLLTDLGAEEGTTVAVMDWDSHRYLEAYFAVPMIGAILQTANIRLAPDQLAYTLRHARAEIVLVHRDFFPLVEGILPDLPGIKAIVAIMDGDPGDPPAYAAGEYEALSDAASPDYPFRDFDENALATTFYTTGTTGNPKGVCFSHRQIVLHTLAATGPFGSATLPPELGFGDVYMPLTPMFHVHAWGKPYIATMLGLKQVYPGRYVAEAICRLRTEHKVTFSHCVPTLLQMICHAADEIGTDLSGWKMAVGGSPLTPTLHADARRRGMTLVSGYGMSEACPSIALGRPRMADETDAAAIAANLVRRGVPVPLVGVRVVDEAMNDVPHDGSTRGEVVVRAPWMTRCYVGDAAASEALWRGGWMHTQDIATIDPEGYIQIRDRLKDVIKTGGEWLDSIQIEHLVSTVEGIEEVAVIAIPDVQWGERPLAVIVTRPDVTMTLEALNAPLQAAIQQGALPRYARLDRFETLPALPRTSVGKIDKKAMRTDYC